MKSSAYKITFIINPISGQGQGNQVFKKLPEIMASFGFKKDEWYSCFTSNNILEDDVLSLLNDSKRIIIVGGDGTIGQFLNRLRISPSNAEVGLIPLGTGNDLARTLGIYNLYHQKGLLACIKRLIRARSTEFDIWDVSGSKTLATYLSVGMDAAVLHDFDVARKNNKLPKSVLINKLFYLIKGISRISYRIKNPVTVTIHNAESRQTFNIEGACCCLIGNINSYAGGGSPFRRAIFNDKKLDVVIVKNFWTYFVLTGLSRISRNSSFLVTKFFTVYQAESVEIANFKNEFIQLDGEDFSPKAQPGNIIISHGQKVRLLDLRKIPFGIF